MTFSDFFYALGDIFQWTFNFLQNDFWLVGFMNYGLLTLGFIGFFIWMFKQKKYNDAAKSNPNQIK